MKIDIRPIRQDEIEQVKALVPKGYDEPNWANCFVALDGDTLVGVMSVEPMVVVEPLYIHPCAHRRALVLSNALCWLDGFIRPLAARLGLTKWLGFVSDEHGEFQELVKKHFPVTWYRERPGLWFTRSYSG